jgi:hypothetical protein
MRRRALRASPRRVSGTQCLQTTAMGPWRDPRAAGIQRQEHRQDQNVGNVIQFISNPKILPDNAVETFSLSLQISTQSAGLQSYTANKTLIRDIMVADFKKYTVRAA